MSARQSISPQSSLADQLAYLDAFMAETDDESGALSDDEGTPREQAIQALNEARALLKTVVAETGTPNAPDVTTSSDLDARLARIEARLAAIEEFFG